MTDDELAAIRKRDEEAGPEQWVYDLTILSDLVEQQVRLTITAGLITVLHIEEGRNVRFTQPHLESWWTAVADRRALLAEVERLRAEPARHCECIPCPSPLTGKDGWATNRCPVHGRR